MKSNVSVIMLRWFFLNLVFPLLPVGVIALLLTFGKQDINWSQFTDFLFFSVILTVSALNDLISVQDSWKDDVLWNTMFLGNILGMLTSALLYGAQLYVIHGLSNNHDFVPIFRNSIHPFSIVLAICCAAAGLICKYFTARTEGRL